MLLSYLERGNLLTELAKDQLDYLHEQFVIYLVQGNTFNAVLKNCRSILDDDQAHLDSILRDKLQFMIEDYECNALYKTAILRLAMGDATGFRNLQVNPRRTQTIIKNNASIFKKRVKEIKFDNIGPKHLASIEQENLRQLKSHIYWFVQNKAKFLTLAEPGKSVADIQNDIQIFALIGLRKIYPFRSGLHLLNTLKATVTNRGNSLITYNTADIRRRLIQTETGEHYSVESSGHEDFDSMSQCDPRRETEINTTLDWLNKNHPQYRDIIAFVKSSADQDQFLTWFSKKYCEVNSLAELNTFIKKGDRPYLSFVAEFLGQPRKLVREAFTAMSRAV